MCQYTFFVFFIPFCVFLGIMIREPRTLWSGSSFFIMMLGLAVFLLTALSEHSTWLASHDIFIGILIFLSVLVLGSVIAFPGLLIILFFIEGIKVIRHEGLRPSNLLSVLFSVLLYVYLAVWPFVGKLKKNGTGTVLYAIVSLSALYILSLLAMYSLSAILNLVHLKKDRDADYIVVLGCGIMGDRVTPLLAARIERGAELLRYNPNAVLILSGGQGPGESIPESQAMAAYALERGVPMEKMVLEQKSVSTEENLVFSRALMDGEAPKILIVTTAYHVFRALILARKLGIKCAGFGARTKWYFTLNALMREFAGYLKLTWKRHAVVLGIAAGTLLIITKL